MSFIQMKTIPALFIGRRSIVLASDVAKSSEEGGYQCGGCGSVIVPPIPPEALQHTVVRCGCGEVNQL